MAAAVDAVPEFGAAGRAQARVSLILDNQTYNMQSETGGGHALPNPPNSEVHFT